MSSEEKLNITKPKEHQCSKINEAIDKLKRGVDSVKGISKQSEDSDIEHLADDALYYLEDIEGYLEDFRCAIETVRKWGQEWKDEAKRLFNEYEPDVLSD